MKKILILTGGLLLVLAIVKFPRNKVLLPNEIAGTWATQDERYSDRFFRLSKTSAIFGIGDEEIDVFFIDDTKFITIGPDDVVELSLHKSGENNTKLSLIHEAGENESLRFLNQKKVIWYRSNEEKDLLF